MPNNSQRAQLFGPLPALGNISASTGMVLDASTEMIAIKYHPATTSPITDVDIAVALTGTSPTFVVGIYADAADVPDTATPTQLGTDTPGFTWAATGFSGLKTFGSNSGNLTLNQPVWIVIKYSSGTIDGSNNIQLRNYSSGGSAAPLVGLDMRQRHHNGTNWTTTTPFTSIACLVVKHQDGTYAGMPMTANKAVSAANDIFVNAGTVQVQGIRFKSGSQVKVVGVYVSLTKAGTPNDLVITVYEGDTSKYSATVVAAYVITASATGNVYWFASPILLAADTNLYIILSQTGTSGSNDYDVNVCTFNATYIDAILPADYRFVHGNGTTPSGLTVSTTEFPLMWPVITDAAADLDMAGGLKTHPGMVGGMVA